mmetsp:Transcript_51200/g.148691  ORF Transcript_51200/g.148691 Transcript_51200/m.148691 type:complete len:276 (-) Transcript_51200:246-1073(-)
MLTFWMEREVVSRPPPGCLAFRIAASLCRTPSLRNAHFSSGVSGPISRTLNPSRTGSQTSFSNSTLSSGRHSLSFSVFVTIGEVRSSMHASSSCFISGCPRNFSVPTNPDSGSPPWNGAILWRVAPTTSVLSLSCSLPVLMLTGIFCTWWYSVGTEVTAFPLPADSATLRLRRALTREDFPVPVAPMTQTLLGLLTPPSSSEIDSFRPSTLPPRLCRILANFPLPPGCGTFPSPAVSSTNSLSSFSTALASARNSSLGSLTKPLTSSSLHCTFTS